MFGLEMVLEQLGIDPKKMVADFELLKKTTEETLTKIATSTADTYKKISALEEKQDMILEGIKVCIVNAMREGIVITTEPLSSEMAERLRVVEELLKELTAWKRQQVKLQLAQHTAQQQQNP